MPASVTTSTSWPERNNSISWGTRPCSLPSKNDSTRPDVRTPRSLASRCSLRVSSAAITGAAASAAASPVEASLGRPSGLPARISRPGPGPAARSAPVVIAADPTISAVTTATLLPARSESSPAHEVRPVPPALRPWQPGSALQAWLWTALVTALAAGTRFWALGFPHSKSFDEVYYATEAQEMLRYGYEDNRDYMFIVHPPLGKWLIALSSAIWGDNSLGWRIAPAVAGTLSVLIMVRLARRMFRSTILGVLAGVLLALDGISLVMSRLALLDIFLQLFILAGFAALVLDRDQLRTRLGRLYAAGVDMSAGVPRLGPRPWRLAGGVLLGLALAVKWSALSFWLGFALLSVLWDRGAFKSAGAEQPWLAALKRSIPAGIGSLLVAPLTAYFLSWTGWFVGENSWNRHWGDSHPGTGLFGWLPSGFRSLLDYHHGAYQFH